MKKFKQILGTAALLVLFIGCQEDDLTFGDVKTPTNLSMEVTIANDFSGNVTVVPQADNAITYQVFFLEGLDPVIITDGGQANFRYTQSGQYSQEIKVVAYGTGGASSSLSQLIDLDVILEIEPVALMNIAGEANAGKRWVWDATNAGHFGVGAPSENFPNFFSAAPNSLDPCLYDDVLTFMHDGNGTYNFALETSGATFMNWAEVKRFFPDATPQQFADECRDINDQISVNTDFVIITAIDGSQVLTVTNSTMSYWSGATTYDILELTDNKLVIRGIQDPFDPPGDQLAWYHTFVPEGAPTPACSSSTGATGSGNNDVLVWSEEFDTDGAPCADDWGYDLGTGNNGWGNGESQYYTDRSDNVIIENGVLKITAKAESFAGSDYTSARIKSHQKFDFTYGRVVARAKLPEGGGTWPAIWLLGSNFQTTPWPGCGELDIMEHVGNDQDRIYSSMHFPGNSGGNPISNSMIVPGVSDEFHDYEVIWTPTLIQFFVDGTLLLNYPNDNTLPFDHDFFLIVNVAMGGSFGGSIDPAFNESSLEVDYIRVYQ